MPQPTGPFRVPRVLRRTASWGIQMGKPDGTCGLVPECAAPGRAAASRDPPSGEVTFHVNYSCPLGDLARARHPAVGPVPFARAARRRRGRPRAQDSYLVDSASSHMLVSKIKPCMSKYKQLYGETANGSLNQLSFI